MGKEFAHSKNKSNLFTPFDFMVYKLWEKRKLTPVYKLQLQQLITTRIYSSIEISEKILLEQVWWHATLFSKVKWNLAFDWCIIVDIYYYRRLEASRKFKQATHLDPTSVFHSIQFPYLIYHFWNEMSYFLFIKSSSLSSRVS